MRTRWPRGELFWGVLVVVMVAALFAEGQDRAPQSNAQQSTTAPGGSNIGAITACEGYVADRLKAPATAKFSGWLDSTTAVLKDGTIAVRGTVDAQNGFGALIRNDWVCAVRQSGSGYTLQSVDLVPR